MLAKRSTKRCVGARLPWACSTAWMMRASVLSAAAAVLRSSNSPVWLMLPANTASPTVLSTGMLSPVTLAWSRLLAPCTMRPSSGTRAPGLTRSTLPTGTASTARFCQLPSALCTSAWGGLKSSKPLMALRARSTARASIASAMAYSAMTMAASGHWPMRKAPVTATVISALILSLNWRSAAQPFW